MAESGARLLVVEDNKVNRLLLARSVEQLGHRVGTAENGRIALDMLREDRWDLVLLDVEMPEMDGFQVMEHMLADRRLRDIPVIVTSALEGLQDAVRCIELGADDYLRKPVNAVLLKARIGSSLEKKRLRDELRLTLRRFATPEVEQHLDESGFALGGRHVHGAVMFTDIRGFTTLSEAIGPQECIELLNAWYALMFDAIGAHGGVVNTMAGDGLMAIFGAPLPLQEPSLCAVRAALDMQEMVKLLNDERSAQGKPPLKIGIGIATGEMIAGYAGTHQRASYTCIGDTVNLAARLEAHTKAIDKGIAVDGATWAAVRERIPMESCGVFTFKGKTVATEVYAA
ncbi:adenylate/guanylate cyclase domain-containing protein [Ramlibacter albus]|uniref:Response regulator n=1 Tax=Ramlibacter albus TaxID=2079448 RepID=A0A923MEU9_9BURK|nr:adenylate/guanylate cyclase domain-containing protein [Ramlibacter albus]MBC5767717.1 response regulator [Ramlibacter albus]